MFSMAAVINPNHVSATTHTEYISETYDGSRPNGNSNEAMVTDDGRYVFFRSTANNIVAGDTNSSFDIFRHDRQTGTTSIVSLDSSGGQINLLHSYYDITPDGRFLVFGSADPNLAPPDYNNTTDIFIRDIQDGTTVLLYRSTVNGLGSSRPFISDDGNYIFFSTVQLSQGNTTANLYRINRLTHELKLISHNQNGGAANGFVPSDSGGVSISSDGSVVAFSTAAGNLVADDTNGQVDIFVWREITDSVSRENVSSSGQQANQASSGPRLSGDGTKLVFNSVATNLTTGTSASQRNNVFLKDLLTGNLNLISVNPSGGEANSSSVVVDLSRDGELISLSSTATDLVSHGVDAGKNLYIQTEHGIQHIANGDFYAMNYDGKYFIYDDHPQGYTSGSAVYLLSRVPNKLMSLAALTNPTNLNPELTWDTQNTVDEYMIYRNGIYVGSTTNASYIDYSANEGESLYYVTAVSDSIESDPSNSVPVLVDRTIPTIASETSPLANTNNWNNTDVTVTFTCTDESSGVASCSEPVTLTDESAGQTATGTAIDNAGNESSTTTEPINIDKTAPNFGTPLWSDDTIRTDESATLTIPVSDSLSGVDSGEYFIGTDPGVGNGTALTFDGNGLAAEFSNLGAGVYTVSYRAADIAGNWTDVQTTTLTVRPLAPSGLGALTPTNTDPTLNWTAVQTADEYHVYRNGVLLNTTTNTTYSDVAAQEGSIDYHVTAVTNGIESDPSNTTTVVVDRMTPTVIYTQAPTANENGWYNTDVTVTFTCNDAQTGIASCTSPITLSNEGSGQTATGSATDNAGNESSVTTGSINIDKTAPTVNSPSMTGGLGSLYVLTTNTTITATANDNLSGVFRAEYYFDTDPGVGNGTAMTVNGSTVSANGSLSGLFGQHTLYVRVQDAAGNWSNLASYIFTRIGL